MARSFNPYPIVRVINILASTLFLSALIYVFMDYVERIWMTLMAAVWLLGAVSVMASLVSVKFHTLTLDESGLVYQSGVLSTRRIVIPYAKVTEASYHQNLVQRIFGVGTLNVDTAGGSFMAIHMYDVKHSHLMLILDDVRRRGGKGDGT